MVEAPVLVQQRNTVETTIKIDNFVEWISSITEYVDAQAQSMSRPQPLFICKSVCSKIIPVRAPLGPNGEGGEDYCFDLGIDLYNDVSLVAVKRLVQSVFYIPCSDARDKPKGLIGSTSFPVKFRLSVMAVCLRDCLVGWMELDRK